MKSSKDILDKHSALILLGTSRRERNQQDNHRWTNMFLKHLLLGLILLLSNSAFSQQTNLLPDTAYSMARTLAFRGAWGEAQEVLVPLLQREPAYADARLLLARTYAWSAQYDEALAQLDTVLSAWPHQVEALALQVEIAHWRGDAPRALVLVEEALAHHPGTTELLLKKARLCLQLARYDEALQALAGIAPEAQSAEAANLMAAIRAQHYVAEVTVNAGADVFSRYLDPAYNLSLQAAFPRVAGQLIVRVNGAQRFGLRGWQPELEWYPRLSKKMYGYLNYGYSRQALFPSHRMGAELYRYAGPGVEVSLGYRYMGWSEVNRVHLYTGSASYYYRQALFTARPSLVVAGNTVTYSFSGQWRQYFRQGNDYLQLILQTGLLPDERRLQPGAGLPPEQFGSLHSRSAGVGFHKTLPRQLAMRLNYQLELREVHFNSAVLLQLHSFQVALSKKLSSGKGASQHKSGKS